MGSVYIKQNTHSKWYYIQLTGQKSYLSSYKYIKLYKGKEQKKGSVKKIAEINWNREYKSAAYKYNTHDACGKKAFYKAPQKIERDH